MKAFFDDIFDMIRKNERVAEIGKLARVNGFKFKNKEAWSMQDYLLKSFSIFKGKKDRRIKGLLWKQEAPLETAIRMYDYYYFGEMKTYKTTIYEVNCQQLNLPRFEIHPKGFLKKVSDLFVSSDKPYKDDADFHSSYEIFTEHPKAFEEALNPNFLDYLLEQKKISAEGEGDLLILYHNNHLVPPHQMLKDYHHLLQLVDDLLHDDTDEYV